MRVHALRLEAARFVMSHIERCLTVVEIAHSMHEEIPENIV